jgi:hypothetical protein
MEDFRSGMGRPNQKLKQELGISMTDLPINQKPNEVYNLVHWAREHVYDPCDFSCTTPIEESESADYGASTFSVDGKTVRFRVAKVTPTKVGQFVTLWKRNTQGITEPFSHADLDFIIVTTRHESKIGQFIFPVSALLVHGVISENGKGGKRGIRVYPSWDKTINKQAQKTQQWQSLFFIDFTHEIHIQLVQHLFLK